MSTLSCELVYPQRDVGFPLGALFPRGMSCLAWGGILSTMERIRGRIISSLLSCSLSKRHTTFNTSCGCVSREILDAYPRGRAWCSQHHHGNRATPLLYCRVFVLIDCCTWCRIGSLRVVRFPRMCEKTVYRDRTRYLRYLLIFLFGLLSL